MIEAPAAGACSAPWRRLLPVSAAAAGALADGGRVVFRVGGAVALLNAL